MSKKWMNPDRIATYLTLLPKLPGPMGTGRANGTRHHLWCILPLGFVLQKMSMPVRSSQVADKYCELQLHQMLRE